MLNAAAFDRVISTIEDDIVPVLRCLGTLGGMLKGVQAAIREELRQDVPLSLAMLSSALLTSRPTLFKRALHGCVAE